MVEWVRVRDTTAEWQTAISLVRHVVKWRGKLCIACGEEVPHRPGVLRLYCSVRCRRRAWTRRGRIRELLNEGQVACPMCGSKP